MPVLPFAEYRPDVSDFNGQTTKNVVNVVPRGDGYGPLPNLATVTQTLPATCAGSFLARNADGSVSIFAGTSTKLYKLNTTTGTWTDVSRSGGTYNALSSTAIWQFAQFNNFVFATQQNDKLQIFDVTSSTAFADRADSNCPQASFVTVVNSFLVLCGILANNVYRIQWSGLNDVSSSSAFTSGVNSSDFQDLADGGLVRGVSGGEYGVIFQDQVIRRLIYAPGSPYIFQIERIASDDGLYLPYSLIRSGNNVFWLSPQGFKVLPPGGVPTPIGKERVDRTFFADCDLTNPQLMIGSNDPSNTRVFWQYKSNGNSGAFADKMLCYDWALDKWAPVNGGGWVGTTMIVSLAQPGVNLEGVDAAFGLGTPISVTGVTTAGVLSVQNTFQAGFGVTFATTGTLPFTFAVGSPYYVLATNLTTTTIQLSAQAGVGANAGATISGSSTTTSTGTGNFTVAPQSLDNLSVATLDAISAASVTKMGAVDTTGRFGFFNGSNLQAILETPEQSSDSIGYGTYPSVPGYGGTRLYLRGFRAVTDSAAVFGSASYREGPAGAYTYSAENQADIRGFVPLRVSTRYARARVRIPASSIWTYAAGIEPNVSPEGLR